MDTLAYWRFITVVKDFIAQVRESSRIFKEYFYLGLVASKLFFFVTNGGKNKLECLFDQTKGAPLGYGLASSKNNSIDWKNVTKTNALAYFVTNGLKKHATGEHSSLFCSTISDWEYQAPGSDLNRQERSHFCPSLI